MDEDESQSIRARMWRIQRTKDSQPDAFRTFAGSARLALPLLGAQIHDDTKVFDMKTSLWVGE